MVYFLKIEFFFSSCLSHSRVDEARLMQYFPLQKVIDGLFDLSKLLFDVDFKVNIFP